MIKTLLKRVREYKVASLLSPLFVSLEVVLECLIPFVMAKVIDENTGNLNPIIKYGSILIVMAFTSLLCGVLAGKFCSKAAAGLAKNIRHDLFHKVQDFSFENIDNFSTSSLVTRMTTDVGNVQMSYMMIIRTAIRAPFMLIFALFMAFQISSKLALIFVAVVPFLGFALFFIIFKVMPLFQRVFKKYDKINDSIQENISGIRVVKSYVREEYEIKKFESAAGDVAKDFTRAEKILAFNGPIMQFAIYISNILIAILGARLIINTNQVDLKVGELTSLLAYEMQILSSLMMVSMIFVMITISIPCMKRIAEVLNEDSTIINPENPIYEVTNGNISFENVSFKYSKKAEKNALNNINLNIQSGQTVGIIGGTGSSKTTLIQLISRLYDASEGIVKVGDKDVKEYDIVTLRDAVSVVLQKNVLFSGSIKENLRWGDKNASDEELIEACKLAQAHEFIESFPDKYDTHIEQGGTNVSGGQKQRLCIARALLKKPKILILDDSTSAVDTKTDALIRKAFKEYIPETTKIIIAQRISSIMESDLILVMDNGEIVDQGNHDELLSRNKIYQEVYYTQNKIGGASNED